MSVCVGRESFKFPLAAGYGMVTSLRSFLTLKLGGHRGNSDLILVGNFSVLQIFHRKHDIPDATDATPTGRTYVPDEWVSN